jgi:hypothetical protein
MNVSRKMIAAFVLAAIVSHAPIAQASYFEFCRLSGFLVSTPERKGDAVSFRLYVRTAGPAVCGVATSSEPEVCSAYVGQTLSVGLPVDKASHLVLKSDAELIQRVWLETTGRARAAWQPADACE